MADKRREALIQGDTIIKGTILNAGAIDVYGYVEGNVAAQELRVHEGGRIAGKLKVDTAEVRGTLLEHNYRLFDGDRLADGETPVAACSCNTLAKPVEFVR